MVRRPELPRLESIKGGLTSNLNNLSTALVLRHNLAERVVRSKVPSSVRPPKRPALLTGLHLLPALVLALALLAQRALLCYMVLVRWL